MKKEKLVFFIVDDDPFSAAIFRQYLIFEGYRQIHVFNSGKECLNNLNQEPDVIILDHHMSPQNGMEVLDKVKERKPGTYVIYVSSDSDTAVIANSLKKGAFCYIIKGEHELKNMVNELKKIENDIKLLKFNSFNQTKEMPFTYNRNAFSLS